MARAVLVGSLPAVGIRNGSYSMPRIPPPAPSRVAAPMRTKAGSSSSGCAVCWATIEPNAGYLTLAVGR